MLNKEQAIEFVKDQINQYLSIKDQHNKSLKVGYVNGLNTAFLRLGLFTIDDFNELQELLRLAIIAQK